uniref:rapamycin-insensitive companion of mTOR isoform X2 n=1 Tax=Ciona intestinalis TaxID=7719 RepID=UPI00089DC402|nr:rapamycin-insensitive companion of mTOR isoform X2 [Ciona intestinalis]|eukprot:XP_026694309.1 rapamycin-insensitive companion of mTOR isoform X2 [Ciona intestinalis]
MSSLAVIPASSKRVKSLRIRTGRSGSDPNEILKEILINVSAKQRVSTERKLGHLNNLVKLFCSVPDDDVITIPMEVIMTCLKPTLVSEVKEVRAAGVRAYRYLINDEPSKRIFMDLKLDYLITKCLDISHFNEVERIQAIRLVRKIAHIKQRTNETIIPLSLASCIVSVSLGGAEERDRVYRTCLAVLCELALLQPWLVVRCNGILALINAVLECHMYQRINECLCMSLMHIINHPCIREWHPTILDVGPTLAPYTELNYRFHADVEDTKLKDELEMRFAASKMAIVSLLRTWDGLFHIVKSRDMIGSLVNAIRIPYNNIRRGIFAVLCDLFYFNEPTWTEDFETALKAAAPGSFRDNWRHSEGFVVAETKSLLPVHSSSRPDLVNSHLAILLSSFVQSGLLQALSSVAVSSDAQSAISSTILLGSLLHLNSRLLPHKDVSTNQWLLPDLLKNTGTNLEENLRINLAVKRLGEVHAMLTSPPNTYSLYLNQLQYNVKQTKREPSSQPRSRTSSGTSLDTTPTSFSLIRRNRSLNIIRDHSEELTLLALKNTKVLTTKEKEDWDWGSLCSLLLSPPSIIFLQNLGVDETVRRFFRRLIYFYLPSSKLFSAIDLAQDGGHDHNRIYVVTACHMVQFLSNSDQEGQRLLRNLVEDILAFLPKTNTETGGYSRSNGSLGVTCARDYYLILGSLSGHRHGDNILQQCKVYKYYLDLASETTHESLIKLMISGLRYNQNNNARAVLSKVLKTCNEASRLYATGFLRVLLRTNCPGFHHWGSELLTTQLFDRSNEVTAEAIDILHEACYDKQYLRAVVRLRPTLLHLGDRGSLLVCRFISDPKGFEYLSQNHYLTRELGRWRSQYNEKYVLYVEELLKLSLTSFERPNKEDGFVRRSGNRKYRQSVFLPAHLYGELCKHEKGAKLLEREGACKDLTETLSQQIKLLGHTHDSSKSPETEMNGCENKLAGEDGQMLKLKSCLWALAHIGSTVWGLALLRSSGALPIISKLASETDKPSIKGTCVYCLSAVAQTIPGVEELRCLGWESVLTMVNTLDDQREIPDTPIVPVVTPHLKRNLSIKKSTSRVSQRSNASSNSKSSRFSPDGSISNLSLTTSDLSPSSSANEEILKPWSLSRNESLKKKSKKKPSSQDDYIFITTQTSASDSIASSEQSVSETGGSMTSPLSSKTPSPSNDITMTSYDSSFSSLKKSDWKKHGAPVAVGNGPKPRMRDRFLEFFTKKSRSKSLAYGSLFGMNHKHHDDSSSGYVSDHIATNDHLATGDNHDNDDVVKDHPPLALGSSDRAIGRLHSSTTLTSSSNVSIETVKTSEIRSDDQHKNGSRTSLWNTNNSGQTGSALGEQEKMVYDEKTIDKFDSQRSRSLPDMLELSKPTLEAPRTLNLVRKPKLNGEIPQGVVAPVQPPQVLVHADTLELKSPTACMPQYVKVETKTCNVVENKTNLLTSDASEKSEFAFSRLRGNTQISQDSGIVDSTSPSRNLERCDVIVVDSDETMSELEPGWKLTKPKGITAARALRNRTDSLTRPEMEVLPHEDKISILHQTRYVGIVVPSDFNKFMKRVDLDKEESKETKPSLVALYEDMMDKDQDPGETPTKPTRS